MRNQARPLRSSCLYLIRHCTTASNAVRYGGWEDEPLDDNGFKQAGQLAARLSSHTLHAVYASPLSRAFDTARPVASNHGLSVEVREALKEINYGSYQGMTKHAHPLNIRKEHVFEPMPGGESLADVAARLDTFIPELSARLFEGERIVVVGHFWSNRILLGRLMRLPLECMIGQLNYKPKNASILDVSFECANDSGLIVESTRVHGENVEGLTA